LTTYGNTYLAINAGNVGIGITNPQNKLQISDSANAGFALYESNAAPPGAWLRVRQSRGTIAAPTAVLTGDSLGGLSIGGHDGTGWATMSAGIEARATENFGAAAHGGGLILWTTPAGSTTNQRRVTITDSGNVGIATTNPQAILAVHNDFGFPILRLEGGANPASTVTIGALGQLLISTTAAGEYITLSANGGTGLTVSSADNVGIGLLAPTQKLTLGSGNILLPNANSGTDGNLFFGGTPNTGQVGMRLFGGLVNGAIPAGFIDVLSTDANDGLRFRLDSTAGNTERMRITSNGNVGIGSAAPSARLDVVSPSGAGALTPTAHIQNLDNVNGRHVLILESPTVSNTTFFIYGSGNGGQQFTVSTSGQTLLGQLHVGLGGGGFSGPLSVENMRPLGAATTISWDPATGEIIAAASSRRYKDKIQPFKDDFYKILQLSPKSFVYKGANRREIGYIAEDLDDIGLKDLLYYNKDKQPESIHYDKIPLYLLEIVKVQQKELADLKKELAELKSKIK
jgi:hypothetical protein